MEGLVHILEIITAEDYDPVMIANEEAEEMERYLKESKLEQVLEEV